MNSFGSNTYDRNVNMTMTLRSCTAISKAPHFLNSTHSVPLSNLSTGSLRSWSRKSVRREKTTSRCYFHQQSHHRHGILFTITTWIYSDLLVLLPPTITSWTWNLTHDHNVNIFRPTFCQSFVVSMETEIHERIINDRRTMVVVDDDRWVHHSSLMKFCVSTTLQLMKMINQ